MRRLLTLPILCLVAAVLLLVPSAGAKTVELHTFTNAFTGSDVNGGPPPGTTLEKLDVNNATGDVIATSANGIYGFTSSGASQPFSALAPATFFTPGIGTNNAGGLAVDNSGGSTQGRIYAFAESQPIRGYEASGAPLGGSFPVAPNGDNCGVAVDAQGNIWRQRYGGALEEFGSDGQPTGTEVEVDGQRGFCKFEIDAQGNFYAPTGYFGGQINKYAPDGSFLATVDSASSGRDVAVDRSTGDIYVDNGTSIEHLTSAGELVEEFGSFENSQGVAVNSSTHAVYAVNNAAPGQIERFSSAGSVTVATAKTEPVSELERTSATLNGKLNPDGIATTDCRIEWGIYYLGFPESVPCAEGNIFSGNAETAVSGAIAGLEVETEYHYRLRVADANGVSYGATQNFKTFGAVKSTATGEATVVDASHAILHGELDPDGIETHYLFEFAKNFFAEEPTQVPAPPGGNAGSAPGVQEVSTPVSGLEAGTSADGQEYQFRIRAENVSGHTFGEIVSFHMPPHVQGVATLPATEPSLTGATFNGSFEPNGKATESHFEYGATASYGHETPVENSAGTGAKTVGAHVTGLEAGSTVHYRLATVNADGITYGSDQSVRLGEAPRISGDRAVEVNTDTTVLVATINPDNRATTYHWEYGTEDCSISACQQSEEKTIPSGLTALPVHLNLEGLVPGGIYHFRLITSNELGEVMGDDHSFVTYVAESGADTCANVLERKQTGAAATRHCRAYELVSAPDTGGYDVESNLISGLTPIAGFPNADGKVLYTVRFGSIPGSGNPTNKGGDPYLATRGENGWTTEYVGFQADGTPSAAPFASTLLEADQGLGALAFGGPELCSPCFADGSTNIPLRIGSGPIEKGMAGALDPTAEPAGETAKTFSADGTHLVFGSTSRFDSTGNEGSLSIYERDLRKGGGTEVVSTMPDGSTMPGPGTAELDVSADGSRVLIGREVGTDADGNRLYDLYMHFAGSPESVEVASTSHGVLYSGMSADGSMVYFTTADQLGGESDGGADLFRADISAGGSAVTRVSTGAGGAGDADACNPVPNSDGNHWNTPGAASAATCGVVAIAGGGGVASDGGTVYFLSPERLDGSSGVAGQPNLYVAESGGAPTLVATLDPDNPLVRDSVTAAGERKSADFQTTPDGQFAVFGNQTVLTENETNGHAEIYRSEVGGGLACVSCIPSNTVPTTDTRLTARGLNLVDDGRVFFTTSEQLVLRDTNQLKDAYEWDEGTIALISTGLDSNDSGLLTATADGRDVFFFTRQTLAPQDENGGSMKIYDAREGGGVLYNPPPRPCVASDECHGAGTQQAPPPAINTIGGNGRQQKSGGGQAKAKHCHKGTVKRHGECVKAPKHHKKHKRQSGGNKGRHHG